MSEVVYTTKRDNRVRARIEASGAALAIFKTSRRNAIIRDSMQMAAEKLVQNFWALRFTKYIQRQPFGYPKVAAKLAIKKLRSGKFENKGLWQSVIAREFGGWDPWDNKRWQIPIEELRKFARRSPGKYKRKFVSSLISSDPVYGLTQDGWKELRADYRRWAKVRSLEIAQNLYEDEYIKPLVLSGTLRNSALTDVRIKSIAKTKKTQSTISTPREGRQNKWAVRVLGMISSWEFDRFVRYFSEALKRNIIGSQAAGFAKKIPKRRQRIPGIGA